MSPRMSIGDQFKIRQLLPGTRPPAEDERLLQLFRNRAELKKEFLGLQDERYALLEKLKKQESATQRAKEQLEQLEVHLGNPDVGPQALTYFQLKALWALCGAKVAKLSAELKQQQEERERRKQLIEFDQSRRRKLAAADRQLLDLQSRAATLETKVTQLEETLRRLRGFWHYFKRRKLTEQIAAARMEWDVAATEVTDAADDRALVEAEPAPVFPGISTEGRRQVNVAVIAYAQHLVEQLAEGGLAALAKETTVRRVYDVQYGSREQCQKVMGLVRAALSQLAADGDFKGLKERTDRLRTEVVYRSDADTVPQTDSVGDTSAGQAAPGEPRTLVNVLVDDYWDVYRSLLP